MINRVFNSVLLVYVDHNLNFVTSKLQILLRYMSQNIEQLPVPAEGVLIWQLNGLEEATTFKQFNTFMSQYNMKHRNMAQSSDVN